jgi:hypothetical protein
MIDKPEMEKIEGDVTEDDEKNQISLEYVMELLASFHREIPGGGILRIGNMEYGTEGQASISMESPGSDPTIIFEFKIKVNIDRVYSQDTPKDKMELN